jgi:AraC family transcriptional activator of pobA
MNQKIIQYKGLYGDDQVPYLPNFIHIESLELRSKTYNWEIADHTHSDLFQLFIIRKGGGVLISEETEILITGPSIISVPTNRLHGFRFQSDIAGEVLTLSESFLEGILKKRPRLLLEVNQMKQSLFEPSEQLFKEILYIITQIQRELIEEHPEKEMGLRSYFQLLFLQLYR